MNARPAALEVVGLRVGFPALSVDVVKQLNLRAEVGETLCLVGESGSGKTMSLLAIANLLPQGARATGSVRLFDTEILGLHEQALRPLRGTAMAVVFQDADRSLNPTMRVGHQLLEALRLHAHSAGRPARPDAVDHLGMVRLADPDRVFDLYPHELSGGMRQRAAIAIALAGKPSVLIADEPTTGQDVVTQAAVLHLLAELRAELDMTLILVSHDLRLASGFADSVVVLRGGSVVEHLPAATLFGGQRDPYTRRLVEAASVRPHAGNGTRGLRSDAAETLVVGHLVQEFPGARAGSPPVQALSDMSLTIVAGETVALVGESGSGKTTLARAILHSPRAIAGSVQLGGTDLGGLSRRDLLQQLRVVQMLFQEPYDSVDPTWRVSRVVEEPLRAQGIKKPRDRRTRANAFLRMVGLDPDRLGSRRAHQLSGGQVQLVALARALAAQPALLICDEATGSLDVLTQESLLDLLARLQHELQFACLFVAHDLRVVAKVIHRVAVLYLGQLCEVGPTGRILSSPAHPYTRMLLSIAAITPAGDSIPTRVTDWRDIPTAHDPPPGCRFHTRCPAATDVCAEEVPAMRILGPGHTVACHFPLSQQDGASAEKPISTSPRSVSCH